MRVFVVGIGRSGTTTFSKACDHITNYTSSHETRIQASGIPRFPQNRIEVNGYLSHVLALLVQRYPDARFVHLKRARGAVVDSMVARRSSALSGPGWWMGLVLALDHRQMSAQQYRDACVLCYDAVTSQVSSVLQTASHSSEILLEDLASADSRGPVFRGFWEGIRAEGDFRTACSEFDIRYNARG